MAHLGLLLFIFALVLGDQIFAYSAKIMEAGDPLAAAIPVAAYMLALAIGFSSYLRYRSYDE